MLRSIQYNTEDVIRKGVREFWNHGYIILEKYFEEELMDEYTEMILKHYGQTPEWGHNNEFLSKSATEVIPWFPYDEENTRFNTINDDKFLSDLTRAIIGQNIPGRRYGKNIFGIPIGGYAIIAGPSITIGWNGFLINTMRRVGFRIFTTIPII